MNYVAHTTSDALPPGAAFNTLVGVPTGLAPFLAVRRIAALIALYGYHWIHRVNLLAQPAAHGGHGRADRRGPVRRPGLLAGAFAFGEFKLAAFMQVFVIVAKFQLGWAPYVAPTRDLPGLSASGSTFRGHLSRERPVGDRAFVLAAVMSAAGPDAADPVAAFRGAADRLFGGFGWIAVFALLLGLLSVMGTTYTGA